MTVQRSLFLDVGNTRMTLVMATGLQHSQNGKYVADETDHEIGHKIDHEIDHETDHASDHEIDHETNPIPQPRWSPLISCKTGDTDRFLVELEKNLQQLPKLRHITASSVRTSAKKELTARCPLHIDWIERQELQPYAGNYQTPETLGIDRLLTALGAWNQTKKNTVIIDAGTACTVDAIRADGTFAGGVIMPGLRALHQSLRSTAPELPPVSMQLPESFPGMSTNTCLQWGLNSFFVDGVIAQLNRFISTMGAMPVFITGGDASRLHTWLQESSAFWLKLNQTDSLTKPGPSHKIFTSEHAHLLKKNQITHSPWLIFEGMAFLRN